jgi:hypothetical protein
MAYKIGNSGGTALNVALFSNVLIERFADRGYLEVHQLHYVGWVAEGA